MDMELQHTRLGGFRPVYETLLRQEETLESIVPDAFPDIARIVEASGTAFLRQKETVDGSVRVTGSARVSVLYLPEGGDAPCCMAVNIPFLCNGDHPAIREDCRTQASVSIISADAQALNPRKILVRVEAAVPVTVYAEETAEICSKISREDDGTLQTLVESHKDFSAVDIVEKNFSFSDVLRLPASKPAVGQMLSYRTELGCTEAKVIGRKLVIKGEAALNVRYLCESGVNAFRFDMPFSQIVETRADSEDCEVRMDAMLLGSSCELRSDGELEVELEVLLQAAIQREREVSMLSDLYSTECPLETEKNKVKLCTLVERGNRRQLARQFCPSAIPAKQVIECRLSMGEISQVRSGEGAVMATAKAYVDVLFLSEDDSLCAVAYTVPATCELPVSDGCKCSCRCRPAGELVAAPVTGGLEVRFEAEFDYLTTRDNETMCIAAVRPGQQDECACDRPSVIIRMVGDGERLWDIAKCCGSTVHDIRAANAMDCDDVPYGTLLLIPKCKS